MSHAERTEGHYSVSDLGERVLAALTAAGKDVDALDVDDLAPVDAFHIRGRPATEELASWAALGVDDVVLDVGSGLGGTSRYLASTSGCRVVGVDLTEAYCRVAEMLSARVGLAERTAYHHGSAVDLPFDDASFDVGWTEHVQMNVADKGAFYGELRRVLRPGGRLAFHDIFAGAGEELRFPVPWASDASISHLAPVEDVADLLASLGFRTLRWEDKTADSLAFFGARMEAIASDGWQPLGLHLLMGDEASRKFENVRWNLEAGRLRVAQAVMERG